MISDELSRAAELVALMEDEYKNGTLNDYEVRNYECARTLLNVPLGVSASIPKLHKPWFTKKDIEEIIAIIVFMSAMICGLAILVTIAYFVMLMCVGVATILIP